jgi:hypothetical protein
LLSEMGESESRPRPRHGPTPPDVGYLAAGDICRGNGRSREALITTQGCRGGVRRRFRSRRRNGPRQASRRSSSSTRSTSAGPGWRLP